MLNVTTEITFLALCAVKSQLPSTPTEDQPPLIPPQPLPIQFQPIQHQPLPIQPQPIQRQPIQRQPLPIQPQPIQRQPLPEVENDNPSTVANDGMLIVCVGISHRHLVYSELNVV